MGLWRGLLEWRGFIWGFHWGYEGAACLCGALLGGMRAPACCPRRPCPVQGMAVASEGGNGSGVRRIHAREAGSEGSVLVAGRFRRSAGQPVRDYAAEARIQLLDGASIVERIRALDQDKQAALLARAFEGDYRTPTCVACGVKLLPREGRGRLFWGCQNFSNGCRITLPRAA